MPVNDYNDHYISIDLWNNILMLKFSGPSITMRLFSI